ncbi:MAG: glycolate oxidase subunit GlcD [Gammaproteobacteria bacterium]|jgi:glycolate oxidase|uniref:glycolate oxidase subunit GlcD n=1 Tax=Stutzerimonas TaxID=2901164 RepID=UPI000C9B918D|nr:MULTISPECIES: glycolate oxidase subunit GlcD [Stutzerimonas]MBU1302983.1 glycolate oxidase subunit GlcD [Gammaproteobacteria bacterium]MBK3844886.1 glycolate oxidase subunit GlcD [Stutzerimonas xanthomarina]MBU1459469.1 glycolate oxidase subunit GlcD [Gammaproteobacteria bacterium]MBU1772318.1 glycolate oxidase subunit GlcD [Gammaproteobacteria bacterium]MBU2283780.1 glycolate oxidase subunit GlcD [Gammaproteobacteria bacterium]
MNILYDERVDGELPKVDKAALLAELQAQLPGMDILHRGEDLKPYECDGLSAYRTTPMLVVLPERVEQVETLLKIAHKRGVPVVARGAGTGLSGGALPLEQGILLVMARFNKILEIDPAGRFARVQPGVRNLAISQAAAPYELYYAPDPSSQIACSIGGNVAENAGGVHCLKYGLTVHNLLKVDILTVEGERMVLGSDALDSPGFDLLALFTGSEGMLGIVTEVTVKLLPKPQVAKVLLAAFDSVEKAGRAVGDIIAAGIIPGGLEMMDNLSIRAAEDFIRAGYPVDAEAILLCELDGVEADVHDDCARVGEVLKLAGATEVRLAKDEAERVKFWAGRKNAFPAVGRISPDYYCMDGTIPRRELPGVLKGISDLSDEYGLRVANVFHAGDGNMHPLILFDANTEGELERAEALGGKILELCVKVGGSITGEHGVGREKINQMCSQFNADELTLFHAVKAAFDPSGLLNPGKNIPTLHRCAEFGGMHVHGGQLPFPELERF